MQQHFSAGTLYSDGGNAPKQQSELLPHQYDQQNAQNRQMRPRISTSNGLQQEAAQTSQSNL